MVDDFSNILNVFMEKFESYYDKVNNRIKNWSSDLSEFSLKYEIKDQQSYIKMLENEIHQKDKVILNHKRLQTDFINTTKNSNMKDTLTVIYECMISENTCLIERIKSLEKLLLEKKIIEKREFDSLKSELKDMAAAFSEKNDNNAFYKLKTEISLLKNRLLKYKNQTDSEKLDSIFEILMYVKAEIEKIDRLFVKTSVNNKLKAVEKISNQADSAMILKKQEQMQRTLIKELKGLINDLNLVVKQNSYLFDNKEKLIQYSIDADLRLVQKDVTKVLNKLDGVIGEKDKMISVLEKKLLDEIENKDKYMIDKNTDIFYLMNDIYKSLQESKNITTINSNEYSDLLRVANSNLRKIMEVQEELRAKISTMNSNALNLRMHNVIERLDDLEKDINRLNASEIMTKLNSIKATLE